MTNDNRRIKYNKSDNFLGVKMDNVRSLGMKRNDLRSLVQEIKDVVYKRSGELSIVETIGALELAKLEIIDSQKELLFNNHKN